MWTYSGNHTFNVSCIQAFCTSIDAVVWIPDLLTVLIIGPSIDISIKEDQWMIRVAFVLNSWRQRETIMVNVKIAWDAAVEVPGTTFATAIAVQAVGFITDWKIGQSVLVALVLQSRLPRSTFHIQVELTLGAAEGEAF